MAEKKLENAVLVPGQSVAQFVIEQLLKGLRIQVEINGKTCFGYVYQLDFAIMSENDYVSAKVRITEPEDDDEINLYYLRVLIHTDGTVKIAPNQPDGA